MGGVDRPVVVGLGSNLGDRAAHLEFAVGRLRSLLNDLAVSSLIETAPAGVAEPQPAYLNAVAVGRSDLPAERLLTALHAIERERGRARPFPGAPRTLDLDLILVGDEVISQPGLEVPHPRFRARRFVLAPLAEIAPHLVDPVTGWPVRQLLAALEK